MYKLIKDSTSILRLADSAVIPADITNTDYKNYQTWLAQGNTPQPVDKKTTDQVWEEIKAERDLRKNLGVRVGSKWFHSDDPSRIQQLGLVLLGSNIPSGLQWKTMDGTFTTMTPTLAQQIFAAVANYDATVFGVAEYHRQQMMAAEDPEAYNYKTGWPANFYQQ